MTREEALEIMGIETASEMDAAYRALSKTCHPNGQTPDLPKWERLSAARAVLLAPPPRCLACRGTGRVKVGLVSMFCERCGGKGHA